MATTQQERDELYAAMKSGAKEVFYSSGTTSRRVVFSSEAEMARTLARMDRELGLTKAARKTGYIAVDRGL